MADLITAAQVKSYLGESGTDDDAFFTARAASVSSMIRRLARNEFTAESWIQVFNGSGQKEIGQGLLQRPITSVTALYESSDQTWDASTLIAATDYLIDTDAGRIILEGGARFMRWPQSVRIEYDAGWVTVPEEIQDLAIRWVIRLWRRRDSEGVGAMSLGEGNITYPERTLMSGEDKQILRAYAILKGRRDGKQ